MFKREDDFVRWLGRRMGTAGRGLTLGIGDDAALVRPTPGRGLILTSDWTIEDVHFRLKLHSPDAVGHRALARALSDVAAMGGRPRWALVSLAISRNLPDLWVKRFYGGMARLARRFGVLIVGGDTSVVPDRISIDVVVVGEVLRGRALLRTGAVAGDQIFVSGGLGLSALGLKLLESGGKSQTRSSRDALRAHLYPAPQCALGGTLARRKLATAMMDISDGLSTDLARLCHASGVGARIWESLLPVPHIAEGSHGMQSMPWVRKGPRHKNRAVATRNGTVGEPSGLPFRPARRGRAEPSPTTSPLDPLALALHGGEDYQLLFTVPERAAAKLPLKLCGVPIYHIGVIDPGDTLRLIRASGKVDPLEPAGFDHFRKTRKSEPASYMNLENVGEIVASRKVEVLTGEGKKTVTMRIGKPQQFPDSSGFYCPVQLVGAGDERVRSAGGIDAIQSIQLALRMADALLDSLNTADATHSSAKRPLARNRTS